MNEFENKLRKHSENLKETITVPGDIGEELKECNRFMKKGNSLLKKAGLSAAGLAAAFILCVNVIPAVAYASFDIPILGEIVRIVTLNRFEIDKNGAELSVDTPKIEGLLDKELEDKLNSEFKKNADLIIASFEKDIKELEKEYGEDFHLGVEASYIVRTDNENILAIDTYIVNTVASSSTRHSFYNINKKTREIIELKSLFRDGADYVTPISKYITDEMLRQNENGEGTFWIGNDGAFSGFEEIKEDQNFFINDSGNIVICFDKYEVAIGAQGSPEFEIPTEVVRDILK